MLSDRDGGELHRTSHAVIARGRTAFLPRRNACVDFVRSISDEELLKFVQISRRNYAIREHNPRCELRLGERANGQGNAKGRIGY